MSYAIVYTDTVECEGCGAEIEHLCCGPITEDEDYRLCESCIEQRDEHCGETED